MKYGLMYYKETDNLGDDIQTYAAKRFLPHIDYYIDRESLNCFVPNQKEYVSMIMNGWFLHNKCAWPPSPYINPLLISMHFTSLETVDVGDSYLNGIGGDYLRKLAPIGCRDIETQKRLAKNNIDNFFSGCLTLTIEKFPNIKKEEYICVVDVEDKILEKIKSATNRKIEIITHKVNPKEMNNKDLNTRMKDIEKLLIKYQAAHLVITSRLHVALPCIALGTPVILVLDRNYEKDRLETYLKYPSSFYFKDEFYKLASNDISQNIIEKKQSNNTEYLKIRENLIKICNEFIKKCENDKKDCNNLPDIVKYRNYYVKNIEWYKNLHEIISRKAKENIYEYEKIYYKEENQRKELVKVQEKLQENLNNLENENQQLKLKISEQNNLLNDQKQLFEQKIYGLEQTLNNIYESKSWKFLEKIRKIKKLKGEKN